MTPAGYRPDPAVHDDLLTAGRAPRLAWGPLGVLLGTAAADGRLGQWQRDAERALLSAGAGHLVAEPTGRDAGSVVFRYDPVPVVVEAAEWAVLRQGLAQRALLLDAVLADLYGPRRLIADGTLPAAAVLGARGFVRAAVGLDVARWLVRSATDVVRDASGRFLALADHTDVPVGIGYALAYRSVSARLLGDAVRTLAVGSVEPWLADVRDAVAAVAPASRANPRTVVLAASGSLRFVDHSILATQLGYHLAEDADLAVSGHRLVLRSLGGLEPIDGVLRCTEEGASDPLEVPGSTGGVPGLLALARRGLAGLANPVGSGLGGHLALQPFLGALCQRVLGEPLRLANVETRWCGDPGHRADVLADLGGWVLHDTGGTGPGPSAGAGSVFGDDLDDAGARHWRALVTAQPHRVVAQRKVRLGTSPIESGGRLVPGVVALRCFSVHGPRGVRVMDGGIGRVLDPSVPVVSQASAVGKDVWIVGGAPGRRAPVVVAESAPVPPIAPPIAAPMMLPQVDLGGSIPTRAAEAMFWMGRNAERVDTVARVAAVVLQRLEQDPRAADLGDGAFAAAVTAGVRAISGGLAPAARPGTGSDPGPESAAGLAPGLAAGLASGLAAALGDRPAALGDAAGRLVGGARSVRQFLSGSTWRAIATLPADAATAADELARAAADDGWPPLVLEALERVSLSMAAFSGLVADSVVRGPGWRFLEVGRRVERALLVLGLVEAMLVDAPADAEQPLYETLLAGCESLVAYRRRHRSHVVLATVAANLLADPDNPRAVAFQLDALHHVIGRLPDRSVVAGLRRGLVDARRSCAVPAGSASEVVDRVLAVRPAVLAVAEAVPQAWFRSVDGRGRRVRAVHR